MRTILAQNELKNTKRYMLGFMLRLFLVILILIPCHLSCNGEFEWLQLQFRVSIGLYSLSCLDQKGLSLQQEHKEAVKLLFEGSTLFCHSGSLHEGMGNFNQLGTAFCV